MDHAAIVDALVDVSGTLTAGAGASAQDLEEARAALAAALAGGQPLDSIAPSVARPRPPHASVRAPLTAALHEKFVKPAEEAAATKAKAKAKAPPVMAVEPTFALLRTNPIRSDLDPSTPAWARGVAALRSYGPFLTAEGIATWIDVFKIVKRVALVRAPGGAPIAMLPVLTNLTAGFPSKRELKLGKGSVWISAKLLDGSSPADSYVGVKIQQGRVQLDADFNEAGGAIQISAAAIAKLTLDLDAPPAPAATKGPGADATHSKCNLPKTAVFEFAPAKAGVTSLTPFDATVYGEQVKFQWNGQPAIHGEVTKHLYFPCDVAPKKFIIDKTKVYSKHCAFEFAAPVKHGSWALPVTVAAPADLGEAAGAGSASFAVTKGWSVKWTGLKAAEPVAKATVFVSPGALSVLVTVVKETGRQVFDLWDEAPVNGEPRRASLEVDYTSKATILYLSIPGTEVVLLTGGAVAHTDRPLGVDGTRFAFAAKAATAALIENLTGRFVVAFGTATLTSPPHRAAIALENVLLQVNVPNGFRLIGKLDKDGVAAGLFHMDFGIRGILPTLPDPYAASFAGSSVREGTLGTVTSSVAWPTPWDPKLTFFLTFPAGAGAMGGSVNNATFSNNRVGIVSLLDVSTNADQLGVAIAPRQASDIVVDELSLASAGKNIYVFTVPEISWEPMRAEPLPPPEVVPIAELADPPNDGGPSYVNIDTVHLTPIAPKPAIAMCVQRVQAGDDGNVYITLPFGLRGHADVTKLTQKGGVFEFNTPKFDGDVKGGLQVKMQPPGWQNEAALFNGDANTVEPYGNNVLGKSVATIFNDDFSATAVDSIHRGLPLRRYDLSGYGASVFSDWRDVNATGVKIIQARFDVMVGRTAYEVVKAQSMLFPWGVRVVRTVTIDRRAAGWVNRHDSGWQAATEGIFAFNDPANTFAGRVHPGAVPGVYNVRNIRETLDPTVKFVVAGVNCEFQPCLFDADVRLADKLKVVSGGVAVAGKGTLVQSRDMRGYIQLKPDPFANRQQLATLLDEVGPTGGKVACIVQVAATGAQKGIGMRGVSVDVTYADNPAGGAHLTDPDIVASLRGTVMLPRDGAWSIGRRSGNETAPSSLDANFAVPLTQNVKDASTWHIADPVDIARLDTPFHEFGFVQATGTQKVFFPRPRMTQGAQSVHFPQPPRLADVGALLNATGLFPNLGDALQFPAAETLGIDGEDLSLTRKFPVPASVLPKTLMDFGAVKVDIAYEDEAANRTEVTVAITPQQDPRWTISLAKLTFRVTIASLGSDPLLEIEGSAYADSKTAPTFRDLRVIYGGILAPIQEVFSKLQELTQFIPGGAPKLDVSFSNGKLAVRQSYAIPKLPLGFGYLEDIALYIGLSAQLSPQALDFSVGIGSTEKPFHWLCSPLSGTGVLEVGTRNGALQLLIEAGIGVGLAIDVGIASGSASIVLRFRVDNKVVAPAKFQITILLTGQASVEVLGGLASASLTLTAGLGIIPDPAIPPAYITLVGSVAVGIHISICWVISIDFEGSWQFSQTLTSPVG